MVNGQSEFIHIDAEGNPRMVDVGSKPVSKRIAIAEGRLRINSNTLDLLLTGSGKKGSVLAVATVAAISGAKRTADLIPLCHQLPLEKVDVNFRIIKEEQLLECTAEVKTEARTGVEMEALTAVHIGLLTVYDMCKSVNRDMEVVSIRLRSKTGGSKN